MPGCWRCGETGCRSRWSHLRAACISACGSARRRGVATGGQALDSTEAMRCYLLEQAGLAVVPFEAFGFDGEPGWFRLSVGSVSERAIGEAAGSIARGARAAGCGNLRSRPSPANEWRRCSSSDSAPRWHGCSRWSRHAPPGPRRRVSIYSMTVSDLAFRTVLAAALLAGCARTTNLLDPASPRFSGEYALLGNDSRVTGPIRIVTFNIKLARRIDRAIEVLRSDSLRGADIVTLEEMDDGGVDRIARALRPQLRLLPGLDPPDRAQSTSAPPCSPAGRSRGAGSCCCRTRAGPATSGAPPPPPTWSSAAQRSGSMAFTWRRRQGASDRGARGPDADVLADAARFDRPGGDRGRLQQLRDRRLSRAPRLSLAHQATSTRPSRSSPGTTSSCGGLRPPGRAAPAWCARINGASDHRPVWAVVVPGGRRSAGLAKAAGTR